MKTIHTHALELSGSSYEAGRLLGSRLASVPGLKKRFSSGFPGFGLTQFNQASQCFRRWCPGLTQELAGFADALGCAPEQVLYYGMTWLTPRCSHLALLPSMTASGHPMAARNYEFNDEAEDFTVIKTRITGKYTHIGTSALGIGRDDGINEMGLTVTLSSSGFPVGPLPEMRRPAVAGLQFWAVVRTLLENCRDVKEALSMLKDMPVAYNLNLIVLDREGHCALVETLDGRMAVKTIDRDSGEQALYATNHPVLEELIPYEPQAFVHSIRRYDNITAFLERHRQGITAGQLKAFFLTPYPEGLSCSYYSQFFGTTKTMVLDPVQGSLSLCWGGRPENGWHDFSFSDPFPQETASIEIQNQTADPSIFTYRRLI